MAANNPKTQLVKMGIGTVSVVAIVGVTGWVWQADQASAAGAGTAAHAMEESAPVAKAQGADIESKSFESAAQPVQPSTGTSQQPGQSTTQGRSRSGTFASPSTSGTTQQQPRTRTKHS